MTYDCVQMANARDRTVLEGVMRGSGCVVGRKVEWEWSYKVS